MLFKTRPDDWADPENQPANTTDDGLWRKPDVIGYNDMPAGHARPAKYDGAILSVAPYKLPDGRNY